MATQRTPEQEGRKGQPAPDRYQPAPDDLDVMAHNTPQAGGSAGPKPSYSYKEMREFARDDEEDLQGEEDLAQQLRQLDEDESDGG